MKKLNYFSLILVILLLLSLNALSGCGSKTTETIARPDVVDALAAQKLLTDGNIRFTEGKTLDKEFPNSLQKIAQKGQKPFAVVLTCSESDVSPELLFDRGLGDLLVVRTVGNVIDPIALGSIEYGVEHYKAPLVVVLGHTDCGIIEEVTTARETCPGNIPTIQAKVKPSVKQAQEGEEKGDALVSRAATYNVFNVIEELKASHIIREFTGRSGLKIIGAKYDSTTGKVQWYEDNGCDLGDGVTAPGQDNINISKDDKR